MADEFGGAGVGQSSGEVGQVAELLVQEPDGEQPGVGHDVWAVEGRDDGLPMDVEEGKVRGRTCAHGTKPPRVSEVFGDTTVVIRVRLLSPTPGAQSGLEWPHGHERTNPGSHPGKPEPDD